jgi:putative cell wall-binding protein
VIVGSTSAVSADVATHLRSAVGAGGSVTRPAAGVDRYATGVAVANWATATYGFGWDRIGVATGENFPDALGASVPQGLARTSLLLTPKLTLNAGVRTALTAHKADISTVRFFGSVEAVSQPVRDAVMAAVR